VRVAEDRQPSGDASLRSHSRLSMLRSPWLRAVLVLVFVVVADQVSKHAVNASIVQGEERKFLPGVELVNTRNNGVAFLQGCTQDNIVARIDEGVRVVAGHSEAAAKKGREYQKRTMVV